MKRSDLKRTIKPLVKECIREVLFEEGMLSGIIKEVVSGLGAVPLVENKVDPQEEVRKKNATKAVNEELRKRKKALLDAIGKDAYPGVDLFEDTKPIIPQSSPESSAAALSGVASGDSGVDISGIVALGGKKWSTLIG
jgi:hypothetical protein